MPAVPQPTCLCPPDGDSQILAKINNNLVVLFNIMSSGQFSGQLVNLGECLCSEAQILAALNNNIVSFFESYSAGGVIPVDNSIHTWADLALVDSALLTVPVIKIWFETATSLYHVVVLQAGTDATDTANGIQRPHDYAAGNHKVWYQAGAAG